MNLLAELEVKEEKIYSVDWLTYSWMREKNKLGLGAYISKCLGIEGEFELYECSNDTDHKIEVTGDPISEYDMQEVEEAIAQKGIEVWRLNPLMEYLAQKGYLPLGTYVITMSW